MFSLAKRILKNRLLTLGLFLFTILLLLMAFAPFITGYDPNRGVISARLLPPGTPGHWLGTDANGRDIFTRIIYGFRITFLLSFSSICIAFLLGSILGLIAGFKGGLFDIIISGLTEIQAGFPFIILAVTILSLAQPTIPMIILVLTLSSWIIFARVVRSEVVEKKENTYIYASYSLGASDFWIIKEHFAKQILPKLLAAASLDLASVTILAAILGLLGLGVRPPTPSIGNMMADGKKYITNAWWITTIPGGFLFVFVFSLNLIGQGLKEVIGD